MLRWSRTRRRKREVRKGVGVWLECESCEGFVDPDHVDLAFLVMLCKYYWVIG